MLRGKVFISQRGAVATEHPLASLAALDALRKGGNAFDSATAASFALSVVQPQLSGLGGDFFALFYHAKSGKVFCLNSSGWSPSSLTQDKVRAAGHRRMPISGPLSFVIPGMVKGVHSMHKKFGKMAFPQLLEDSVALAEGGFPVSQGLADAIRSNETVLSGPARKILMPSGGAPAVGDTVTQKDLASSLKAIAAEGPDAYYKGWIAETISRELASAGAEVEADDFKMFEPEWCEPISIPYGDATVYEVPPNSMGATTLLILRLLGKSQLRRTKASSADRIKLTVDAVRAAYARRDSELGDPRFAAFDSAKFLATDSKAESSSRQMKMDEADTTYFAISDEEGNLLSCIQSLFYHFGSKVFVNGCGFFLNNRASAFKFAGPNRVEPRKRPLHTLSALLVSRGETPGLAMGCSGGSYRPQQHALFITNLVDYKMTVDEAIDFPRFLWEGGESLLIEQGFVGLASLSGSKKLLDYPGSTGVAQGVEILPSAKRAVCDIRGEGIPLGN